VDRVHILFHIQETGELLMVGVYKTEADAHAAIERLKEKPGFARHPDRFEIQSYELGVDIWSEGFDEDEAAEAREGEDEEDPEVRTRLH